MEDRDGSVHRFIALLRLLWRILMVILGRRPSHTGCVYIPERIINRPDPCIYSQSLLMSLGLPVTWENPDVAIFLNGVKQYTYDLTVDTTYDVNITLHNSSRDKPANGTRVDVTWMEFGAGTVTHHPIATVIADIPVWPGTRTVMVKWTTPATAGHYCIDIALSHPNDGNPANNRGQNNTQVKQAHSPVESELRVFNLWPDGPPIRRQPAAKRSDGRDAMVAVSERNDRWRHVELTADSYVFEDAIGKEAVPERMFAPRPAAWPMRIEPAAFDFDDGERFRDVKIVVEAPDGPGPEERFNIQARQNGAPVGGMTMIVKRGA